MTDPICCPECYQPLNAEKPAPTYLWTVTVCRWNRHGEKILESLTATILAPTRDEMVRKGREMVGAKYDDFLKLWSHDFVVREVHESMGARS